MNFSGKTVAVTGAAGNLGRGVVKAFAEAGAAVVAIDLKADALDAAFGDEVTKVAVDLLDEAATVKALGDAAEAAGGFDAVCALAGGFYMGDDVHETPSDKWKLLEDLNVHTLLNTLKAVTPGMVDRGSGKIVTVGANAAMKGIPGMGAYCATKGAVLRITESAAMELRDKGINVNSVMPSVIDTPENRAAMPKADPGDWVAPSDLAAVIMFLASDSAKAVHGALVPVVGLS